MKKQILIATFFVLISKLLFAQDDSTSFRKARLVINIMDSPYYYMTNGGLNLFFAKRINTYLTGSSDLSVNQSYFVVDPTDGRLTIAYSKQVDPTKDGKRAKYNFTFGIKTNVKDGVSSIYSGSDKWSKNSGLTIKFTLTGRGIINYDNKKIVQRNELVESKKISKHEDFAKSNRIIMLKQLSDELEKDSTERVNELDNSHYILKKLNPDFIDDRLKTGFRKANNKFISDFFTKEELYISQNQLYKSFWNHWVSFDVYIPLTKNQYDYANSFNGKIVSKSLYNFEGSVSYSNLFETPKSRWIATIALGGKKNNTITTSLIDKYSFGEYKNLGGVDTLKLAQLDSKDIYVGKYEEYFTPFVRLSAASFFVFKKSIGLSFLYEKNFGSYNPTNIKLGIPFNLRGKDDDTKATFELQFKWDDYNNNILPNKTRAEKYTLGLSVGIPLATKI